MTSLYSKARWQKMRAVQLREEPLCAQCTSEGRTSAATVADHVIPHKGNEDLFWNGKLQSLCKPCHDSVKQRIEHHGYAQSIGVDGWPTDSNHPVNRHGGMNGTR